MFNPFGIFSGNSSQMGVPQTSTGPTTGQGATGTARDVQRVAGFGYHASQAAFPGSSPAPVSRAQILADRMNEAIGRDVVFASKERATLEGLSMDSNEITAIMCHHPIRAEESVRASMFQFVSREMESGFSEAQIMQKFIGACDYAEIAQQDIARIKAGFDQIKKDPRPSGVSTGRAVQHASGQPVQVAGGQVGADYVYRLEAELRASRESEQCLIRKLGKAESEVEDFCGELVGLQNKNQKLEEQLHQTQTGPSHVELRAFRQQIAQLEQKVMDDEGLQHEILQENSQLGEQLRQAQVEVAALRQQNSQKQQEIEGLYASKSALRAKYKQSQEQLCQARAGQTSQAAAAEDRTATAPVNLDAYGENREVNHFITRMNTWDLTKWPMVRRRLCEKTNMHKDLWEKLWKGLGFVDDSHISLCNGKNPNNPLEAMVELSHKAISLNENMPFRDVFESEHMPVVLRKAIYETTVAEIHTFTRWTAAR